MPWCVVLMYHDWSGVQQVFGPYDTAEYAARAMESLKTWPTLSGNWEIQQLSFVPTYGNVGDPI